MSIDESKPDLKMAKVDFGGITKDVCIQWLDEAKIGDYVLVHVGFAINKINEKEAEKTLAFLKKSVRKV